MLYDTVTFTVSPSLPCAEVTASSHTFASPANALPADTITVVAIRHKLKNAAITITITIFVDLTVSDEFTSIKETLFSSVPFISLLMFSFLTPSEIVSFQV